MTIEMGLIKLLLKPVMYYSAILSNTWLSNPRKELILDQQLTYTVSNATLSSFIFLFKPQFSADSDSMSP
ncbi:hypothetical protein RYX36_003577, partial [Vicia faba]